jgi:heptosyltransferase-2
MRPVARGGGRHWRSRISRASRPDPTPMRILISNPDTIGDVVLRQPLLARLAREGHELALVAPPLVAPLIDLIAAPEAAVITCPVNPYAARLQPADSRLNGVAEAARSFDPEIVVAAPWQATPLESRLLSEFPGARRIGFAGRRYFDPVRAAPPDWPLPLDEAIEAPAETPELRKNQLLASAILGKAARLPDPKLRPQDEHKTLAQAALDKAGLAPGAYLVACVGHTDWTRIRNWRPQGWAEALVHWQSAHGRDILLIGAENERPAAREVARLMGDAGARCAEWFGSERGDLATLLGLIALSRGYIGRDTGPMHMAAALGKPVLAVFGGGTWPRFCPAVAPSVTLTIGVPCAGCEWRCDLEDSHCIKEVPAAEVIRAIDELESGAVRKRVVRALTPPPALAGRIGVEMTRAARQRLVELSVERHSQKAEESAVTVTLANQEVEAQAALEQERRRRMEAEAELKVLREQRSSDHGRLQRLEEQLERRTTELLEARESRGEHKAAVESHRQAADRLRERIESDARDLAEVKAERDRLRARVGELREAADAARALKDQLAAERRRADEQAAARERLSEEVNRLTERLEQMRRQVTASPAQPPPAETHDLRVNLQRAASDRDAAVKLSRQREQDVAVLQSRLNDLLASRWRKLGQRIGVAITLPWEENLNGHRKHH